MQIQQQQTAYQHNLYPDERGRFGPFGGKFVPESLMAALTELETAYEQACYDVAFQSELQAQLASFVGRPTTLHYVPRFSRMVAPDVKVYLKREDMAHTGAHKINNALGQGLLAKRMGKKRIIAETGAGQHGVATATVCAMLGLECIVYMGETDIQRQSLNVFRMKLLTAFLFAIVGASILILVSVWISAPGCFGTMGKDVQYLEHLERWLRIARVGPLVMPPYRMVITSRKNLVPSVSTVACLGDFLWEPIRYLFADLS